MDLATYRKTRGLTQEQCASELGLRSKSYISGIESGQQPASVKLALKIQQWSQGHVLAGSVVSTEDAKLLQASRAAGSRQPLAQAGTVDQKVAHT